MSEREKVTSKTPSGLNTFLKSKENKIMKAIALGYISYKNQKQKKAGGKPK